MPNTPTTNPRQSLATTLTIKLANEGFDERTVRLAIALIRRGCGDLIKQVVDGEISIQQASAAARGR